MNVYMVEDMKISIGAEVVAVHIGDQKTIPEKIIKEIWANGYFRRNTKTFFAVKGAEVVARSVGIHSLYLFTREHIAPWVPGVIEVVKMIDWERMIMCLDFGFAAGVITAAAIHWTKSRIKNWMSERGATR